MIPVEPCCFEALSEEPCSAFPKDCDEEDCDEEGEEDELVRISNIFDVRGFCHVNLKNADFRITHNEVTG